MDDGRICILFNDGAHIALLPDALNVEFISAGSDAATYFQITSPPPEFTRVAKILVHFVTYMTNNLEEAQKPAEASSGARLVTWSRTNLFVALYLSDGTLQVNFCKDHVKINISSINDNEKILVTYIDEDKNKSTYGKNELSQLAAQTHIVDRLALVHDEFHLLFPESSCTEQAFCMLYRHVSETADNFQLPTVPTAVTAN